MQPLSSEGVGRSDMLVQLHDVAFTYRGARQPALAGVSFAVAAGVTGVLGPNGAGKSTLLRLLAGVQPASRGSVLVNAQPPAAARTAGRIGLIPETPLFDAYLTVADFIGGLSRMLHRQLVRPAQLADVWHAPLGSLSLGQKRTVELAAALLGSPELLLLDEPTNGLDPFATAHLRQTLAELSENTVVFVSSHHLDELQRTADRLLIIDRGRCLGCWDRHAAVREFGSVESLFTSVLGATAPGEPLC